MKRGEAVLFVFLVAALGLRAQTATGRLAGTVVDPAGLAVAGAAVAVKGEATPISLTTTTNATGAFSFPDVPPGEYSIEVSAAGFRRQLVRRFKVDVAKENVLAPLRLEIGTVAETVEVKAEVGQVQTTNAEVAATVTMHQIQHLPLTERDPLSLIHLQAGVVFNGRVASVINGQRTSFSNVTLDGINIQDNFIRANALNFIPNRLLLDEVVEFTITNQNANPALGLGSSQVNFITRSGTNQYHGSAYWYNRNNAFAANEWFSNKSGTPKPRLNLNQFGGSLGGPILRDKLLFYANYEGYRNHQQALANTVVLTSNARNGIFTYRDAANRLLRVNVLSLAGVRADPRATELLARVPGPENINNFDAGDSDVALLRNTAGYRFNVRDNTIRDNGTLRLDYVRSPRHLFSGTYRYNWELVDRADAGNGFHRIPVVNNDGRVKFLSVAWRWTPRPNWTNELRGGMNLAPGKFYSDEQIGTQVFEGFVYTNPVVGFRPQGRDTNTYQYMDNATWQRGRHELRFGGQLQRVNASPYDHGGLLPAYGIGISLSNPRGFDTLPGENVSGEEIDGANALLATLGGIVGSAAQLFNIRDRESGFVEGLEYRRRYYLNNYAFYGQDAWKLGRRLTLNLGVRWEYTGRFDERDGLMLGPIFTSVGVRGTLLSNATLDFAGHRVNRPLYNKDLNNFAPNVGIAWDPFGDGKTAVRAGYTVSFVNDEIMSTNDNATGANDGLISQLSLPDISSTMSGTLPTFRVPQFRVPRLASDNFDLNPGAALFALDPKLRAPYVQQWAIGVQRQVMRDTVVEVRYVGNHGTSLLRGFDFNQVIVRENGFLDDFIRARNNGFLAQARLGRFIPTYNPGIPGSQPLTVFPQMVSDPFLGPGLILHPVIQSLLRSGEPGQLAAVYYVNGLEGRVRFVPNTNTFVADLVTNQSHSTYNALQMEVRRRSASGVEFQANYTFSKVLTDSSGNQVRFDPYLDFRNGSIERSRADFDLTHVFNVNFILPLPMGKGHRLRRAKLDRLLSDWTLGSIVGWQSGAPLSLLSGRGTLNRTTRSGQNTAMTSLTRAELDRIVKLRMTGDGPFLIAASAINPRDNSGVAPDGEPAFNGQVFFHPGPGELGVLQRRLFSGPSAFGLDLKINKDIAINESRRLRIEATFTNLLNHPVFFAGSQAIGSTQFGRLSSVLVGARVTQFGLRYSW